MNRSRAGELLAFSIVALSSAASAHADNIIFGGNYWRDRNTRVVQPEVELSKELPSGTIINAHYLLDTITSASVAAGAIRDQPFTELRNEVGAHLGQRIRNATIGAGYSFSRESDYTSHIVDVTASVDLFQKNTTLSIAGVYGWNSVEARMGPAIFTHVGGLQTVTVNAGWTQLFTRALFGDLTYSIGVLGFGSIDNGFQSNPYRTAVVEGQAERESTPFQRIRQEVGADLRWYIPTRSSLTPYIVLRPGFRFYWDDWGLRSETPELRVHVPVGPAEFRLTGRYYHQNNATFADEVDGKPGYATVTGLPCTSCTMQKTRNGAPVLYYTSDPKLYSFNSVFLELRVSFKFLFLARYKRFPLHDYLSQLIFDLSYGHYFTTGYAQSSYGDANLAGLGLTLPL